MQASQLVMMGKKRMCVQARLLHPSTMRCRRTSSSVRAARSAARSNMCDMRSNDFVAPSTCSGLCLIILMFAVKVWGVAFVVRFVLTLFFEQ
jgi:hypothetical protein